ncbi:MAG: proline dehydrogenase family protein [Ferruginibacter sp.]
MISFDNTEYAFAYKTNKELKGARFLFSSMANSFLVTLGLRLMPAVIKWRIPFSKSMIRKTIFSQFVGGETLEQTSQVADKLEGYNVQVILDYGVEGGDDGDAGYDNATLEFIKVIDYASSQKNIPFISIKVTGIVRFSLLEKIDAAMHNCEGSLINRYNEIISGKLSTEEKEEWQRAVKRMLKICEEANQKNIGVLVDAEESWIQDPVDALTILMMDMFNKEKAVVYNTIQLYRHDRLQFLKDSFEASTKRAFILGAKLVRGAYMEKERKRAELNNYTSPIQPGKHATDTDYNKAVEFSITNIEKIATIIATHNEESNLYATRLLDEKGISHHHKYIHFSQLYGMSDNITFNLAREGFSVSKYLPFGPIKDVIPYLMRRAQENSSVAGQTSRELDLIEKELKRRKQ